MYIVKGTFQAQATSNNEEIKPVTLAIIYYHLKALIKQLVDQKKIQLNIFSSKAFKVAQTLCLGVIIPNQCCHVIVKE